MYIYVCAYVCKMQRILLRGSIEEEGRVYQSPPKKEDVKPGCG